MAPDPWIGAVSCRHRGVLARASTVATWTNSGCCDSATAVGAWRVGVDTASAADEARVIDRIAALDSVALDSVGLPASATLARLSREDLPRCSILLSDGRSVAAITHRLFIGCEKQGHRRGSNISRWRIKAEAG